MAHSLETPLFPLEPDEAVVQRSREIIARSLELLRQTRHLVGAPHREARGSGLEVTGNRICEKSGGPE